MTQEKERPPSRKKGRRGWLYAIAILAAIFIGVGGAWLLARQRDASSTEPEIQLAPVSQLSEKVRSAPLVVQEAYRYAIANPETLAKYPCYCGCGNMGHMNNLDCFIQDLNPDGSIVFDHHALG